jgi:protection-of-telomeres protein 1
MKTQGLTSLETASSASSPNRLPGDQPPVDSDDEDQRKEQKALKERDLNMGPNEPATKLSAEIPVKNKAFTCCIKQYGIKVGEDEPSMANAGNGKRWERRFGLFGTQIG